MDNHQEQTGQGPQQQNPQSNQPPADDTRNRERSPDDPTRGRQGDKLEDELPHAERSSIAQR